MRLEFAVFALTAWGCSSSEFSIASAVDADGSETTVVDDTSAEASPLDDTAIGDEVTADVPIGACVAPGTELFVAPSGSDGAPANGSAGCPFKTIQRALGVATPAITRIVLRKGVYGMSCDGGAPCDTTPITVPSALGLVIAGEAVTSDVTVTGGGDAVFVVPGAAIGFEAMTIVPKKQALAGFGGSGIIFSGPASPSDRAVTRVEIRGHLGTDGAAGTGAAILCKGASTPTIGPSVKLVDGAFGVVVQGTARPRIAGTPAGMVAFSNFGFACVRAAATMASGEKPSFNIDSGPGTMVGVSLSGCGGSAAISIDVANGGTSVIRGVVINKGQSGSGGISVRGTPTVNIAGVSINEAQGVGLYASDTATVMTERTSVLTGTTTGVLLTGSASGQLNSLTANNNAGDGIKCEANAKLSLRGSTLLANKQNGLLVSGNCTAQLGVFGESANNVFNKTSSRNSLSGLCFMSTGAAPTASGSSWSCNRTTTPCLTTAAEVLVRSSALAGAGCTSSVDISEASSLQIAAPGQTCCN